jgi:hypothetical protein
VSLVCDWRPILELNLHPPSSAGQRAASEIAQADVVTPTDHQVFDDLPRCVFLPFDFVLLFVNQMQHRSLTFYFSSLIGFHVFSFQSLL